MKTKTKRKKKEKKIRIEFCRETERNGTKIN